VEIGGGLKYALAQIDCKGTRARARPGMALADQKLVVFSGKNQFSTKLEHISDKPIQADEFQVRSHDASSSSLLVPNRVEIEGCALWRPSLTRTPHTCPGCRDTT
jgi:hypothetical protein